MTKKNATEPSKTEEKLTTLQEELNEVKDQLARTLADYQNFRRRTEEQAEVQKKRATHAITSDILAVIDNLHLALDQTLEKTEFTHGVELIYSQLISTLEEHGAKKIPTEKFDPKVHEAVLLEPNAADKGTIIEVLQPGWLLGGQVIRTAKVKVSLGDKK